jgi:hypothetical protein
MENPSTIIGIDTKFTGFHYDEGGWHVFRRWRYSDKRTSDWERVGVTIDRQSAEQLTTDLEKEFLNGLK